MFGPVVSPLIYNRPVSGPIPFPHIPMVPEKVYVQKLPGRGLACVRRRVPSTRSPFGITAISEAFGMPRAPSSPSDNSVQEIRTYSTGSNRYDPFYPQALHVQNHRGQAGTVTPNPPVYTQEIQTPPNSLQTPPTSVQTSPIVQAPAFIQVSPGLKTTIITETNGQQQGVVKHSCAFCGKYRSGSYQLRHPLRPGEMPKARFCKKCTKEETSSEDSDSSYKKRRKKKHRHHRHSTESSDESSSDRKKGRRQRRRSVSRHRSRRSDTRSSSVDGVRITLARTDESRRSRLATRRRRSSDPVRIVRHVRHVNRTEPSRHQSRDSRDRYSTRGRSEARFYDDGIDRAYISREPSPMRYREPDYLRGYDTLERQRPVRRGTGYYEPPSVAHVRDDYNTGDSAYESGVSDVEIEDPLSPLSRAVRVIRISPETEPRPRSRSRSRSVRITRISSEAEPRSRSRSVRAIRVAQVPRPPSRSVRYLQMSQAPDERRSYESIPDAEQRARSRTPSRHRSSETPFRRRRVRDTSEFESTSSELDHLGTPPIPSCNQS